MVCQNRPMRSRQTRSEFLALMAAASATIAIAIDAMLPAFADVREYFDLAATSSDAALIITVFMIGVGVGQFLYGPLADRFGRKPVFMVGLALYVVAGALLWGRAPETIIAAGVELGLVLTVIVLRALGWLIFGQSRRRNLGSV